MPEQSTTLQCQLPVVRTVRQWADFSISLDLNSFRDSFSTSYTNNLKTVTTENYIDIHGVKRNMFIVTYYLCTFDTW
jgi:hypothetical protein